jgi:hypothetical protein
MLLLILDRLVESAEFLESDADVAVRLPLARDIA